MEVELDELVMNSEKVTVIYHRKGKEPVEVTDASTAYISKYISVYMKPSHFIYITVKI